jgi:AraC-like DNA-binding protein
MPPRPLSIDPSVHALFEGVTRPLWREVPRLLYDTEFIFVSAGSYELSIQGHVFHLEKNFIALVPPATWHESWALPGQTASRHCLHFIWNPNPQGATYPRVAYQAEQFQPKHISSIPPLIRNRFPVVFRAEPSLAGLVRRMFDLLREKDPLGPLLMWPILQSIFEEFTGKRSPVTAYPASVVELKSFIDSHYADSIGTPDFSRITCLSRSRTYSLFKHYLDVSPASYLKLVRIETAKRHLREGSLNVKEVAVASGFPDSNYFCRLFRQEVGMSPGDFRHSLKWQDKNAIN